MDRTASLPLTRQHLLSILIVSLAALVIGGWLLGTPPGILGKADAIGYAVCHRIDVRSFHLGGRPLPLCARCTGMYLGALLGVVVMAAAGRSRAARMPPLPVTALLLSFVAAMGVDGINSYLTFFPGAPRLYEPQNWLRLTTGTLTGLALAAFVYPSFNGTIWQQPEERRALTNLRELGGLLALAALTIGLVLTENPIVLYPLALLSAFGVVLLLTLIQTTLWITLLGRANKVGAWREAALPLLFGLTLAIAQVAAIDALRYALIGTWAGFAL